MDERNKNSIKYARGPWVIYVCSNYLQLRLKRLRRDCNSPLTDSQLEKTYNEPQLSIMHFLLVYCGFFTCEFQICLLLLEQVHPNTTHCHPQKNSSLLKTFPFFKISFCLINSAQQTDWRANLSIYSYYEALEIWLTGIFACLYAYIYYIYLFHFPKISLRVLYC